MGHKHSELKVSAKMTLHGGNGTVDGLRLSYKSRSCWCKGRRVVAAFAFPEDGWLPVSSEGIRQNKSTKGVNVPLEALGKKDGNTSVRITCLAGRVPVYRTQLALGDLLESLLRTKRGNEALLLFNLSGGTVEGGAFTALFCNGRRCGEVRREETTHQRPADATMEAEDHQGQEGSPGLVKEGQISEDSSCVAEDGQEKESIPGPSQDNQSLAGSPSPSQDDQRHEDSPSLGEEHHEHDGVPHQEEQTPQWRGDEDVPPFPDSHETTPHGCQWHGDFNVTEAIGIHLGIFAFCLMLINAYFEWMEY